ncbi:MAG: hypothetical protein J5I98_30375 [Phaeodactylibacter sp.]|nr:hypothetical protein [Phaeodactylibacter sp.]
MLEIEDVKKIYKSNDKKIKGYFIEFNDGRKIHLTKRRTIIALLILIKYGEGTEADLAKGSSKIPEISKVISPTGEDISDLLADRSRFTDD